MEKSSGIQTDLSEGETLNIGGYVISRSEGKIVGDRSAVLEGCDEVRTVDATPGDRGCGTAGYSGERSSD